jgi:hypothetical protein
LGYSALRNADTADGVLRSWCLSFLRSAQFPNLPIASSGRLALRFGSVEIIELHSYEQVDALVYGECWLSPCPSPECQDTVLPIARSDGGDGRTSNAGNDFATPPRYLGLLSPQVVGHRPLQIHFISRSCQSVIPRFIPQVTSCQLPIIFSDNEALFE